MPLLHLWMLPGLQVCEEKKKKVWSCIKASESELWNWPTQHEKRKRGGLPDESLKSESEPCRAPATYVCVRQCVFHHRWLLQLCWVHEFQAVGLQFFFFPERQTEGIYLHTQNVISILFWLRGVFSSHSEFYLLSLKLTHGDTCPPVLQQLMFCLSVLSRWEMQEGAELEEEQKSMVEELQKAYFVSCCSPRLQDCPESDETPEKETHGET